MMKLRCCVGGDLVPNNWISVIFPQRRVISDLQIVVRGRLRVRVFRTEHALRFGGRKFSKCACSELKTRPLRRPPTPI